MFQITIHWVAALQALGIGLLLSVVAFVLANILALYFNRSNGNDLSLIALAIFIFGTVIADFILVSVALFCGISWGLFAVVGVVFGITILMSVLTINGRYPL